MVEKIQKKILIVEDDTHVMRVLMTRLSDEGFTVFAATTGEEGLSMALSEHPHLILIDILLPKMNGIEVVERLRKDEWGKTARVMVVSNLTDDASLQKMQALDVIGYIVKTDLSIEKLIEKVKAEIFL